MVIRPATGAPITIDYRERAPYESTPTMYLDATGKIARQLTATGYLAPGVPGTVRGLAMAHKRFGKLPWKDVVMPAVDLADHGFMLTDALSRSLNREVAGAMAKYPWSVAAYGKPGGGEWVAGDTIKLPDLARTLRAIATNGPNAFYTGWIADSIASTMKTNGGLISKLLESVCHTRLRYHHLPFREDLAFLRNLQDISLRFSWNLVFWKKPIFGNLIECRFLLFGGDIRPGRGHSLRFAKLIVELMDHWWGSTGYSRRSETAPRSPCRKSIKSQT